MRLTGRIMYTIIGADGKEYGPVTADRLRDWIAAGRANAQTRIKAEGGTWTTVGALPEFGQAGAPAPGSPPPAAALPQLSVPPEGNPRAIAEELIARAAPLDILGCFRRSFALWQANLLPLAGVTFVVIMATMLVGVVPIIGSIASLVLTGVFYGGLYYYYLGQMRGERREFADAFAGFTRALAPLALANLLMVAITLGLFLVLLAPWIAYLVLHLKDGGEPHPLAFAGLILCVLPIIYISVAWTFAYALVIDRGLGPWTALEVSRRVVTRQWLRVFLVLLLGSFLALLGLLGLIIGVFFTLPLFFGAVLYAYEDLCWPPAA